MEHFRPVLRRSWDDSWKVFFAAPLWTVILALLVWLLALYLQAKGLAEMVAAFMGLGWTLAAPVFVFAAVFFFHFLYLTPKRMVAEAAVLLKEAEDRAETVASAHKTQLQELQQRHDAVQSELDRVRASITVEPLQIELVPPTKSKDNRTQEQRATIFDGNGLVGIYNPNLTQGIGEVAFTVLGVTPPFRNKSELSPRIDDEALSCMRFTIPGLRDNILQGNQRRAINVFTATRPPHIEATLKDIKIRFNGEWSSKEYWDELVPRQAEHILTVEVSGAGRAGTTVAQIQIIFSTDQKEPVFTLTKLTGLTLKEQGDAQTYETILASSVEQIRQGIHPLTALQKADARKLNTNDDLVRLCKSIKLLTGEHPMAEVELRQDIWLQFLNFAIGWDLGTSEGLLAALDGLQSLPNRIQRLTPPS